MKHMKLKMTRMFAPKLYNQKHALIKNGIRSARFDTASVRILEGFPMLNGFVANHAYKLSIDDQILWLRAYRHQQLIDTRKADAR